MTVNELPQAHPHAGAASSDGTVLTAELAGLLHAGGGLLAVIGLVIPRLRPAHLLAGTAVALAAIVIGWAYHHTREWSWSDVTLRWAVVGSGLSLITAYNLATAAEPFRYSVFYFFLIVWIGLTQPRGTSLRTMPLVAGSYLVPIVVHDASRAAVLSILFIAPTLAVTGELVGWFSAQRTSLRQQLETAVGELRQHDVRRDLFIDTASHELRSPLATIRGSLATLQDRAGQLSEDDTARLVGVLHQPRGQRPSLRAATDPCRRGGRGRHGDRPRGRPRPRRPGGRGLPPLPGVPPRRPDDRARTGPAHRPRAGRAQRRLGGLPTERPEGGLSCVQLPAADSGRDCA